MRLQRFLVYLVLLGLIAEHVTFAKKNKKNNEKEMEDNEDDTNVAMTDDEISDQLDEETVPVNKGKKKQHNSNKCIYSFEVDQSEEQSCSGMDMETKMKIATLEQKSQMHDDILADLVQKSSTDPTALTELQLQLSSIQAMFSSMASMGVNQNSGNTPSQSAPILYKDCQQILEESEMNLKNAIYMIKPWNAERPFKVNCEMEGEDGVWNIIQRRNDGSVDFNMDWIGYKVGFGNMDGEHWIGNDNINRLTSQSKYILRIEFEDWNGNLFYANYMGFLVDNEYARYKLHLGEYQPHFGVNQTTSGDSLSYHDGQEFSTPDRDNDKSEPTQCAKTYMSGWWFNNCFHSNLNGVYLKSGENDIIHGGISWTTLKASNISSIKQVTMKVKRTGFI
ncbi:fibrinogen-like protein 1 [Saccoglossus kowalevskii]|uniref:Angiopoietin-2-like n=1 Tax=Saccoglossus kowalevskii TaxID=10224 RepID=A0ABM0H0S5_SACKO|nr:PREDICTED: angiopoietin-2-like [Saccoglossus kowalevskii]